jgi:glucose/arabinose dehydrogenase
MRNRRSRSLAQGHGRGVRGLRIERLEPRCLLAGDTFLVNFQNGEATSVTGYLIDTGEVFGPRVGGQTYGWSTEHTDQAHERSVAADQRLDTLIQIEAGEDWEFQLPNGNYEVTVAVGDPANNDGVHTINVEDVNFIDAVADTDDPLVVTKQVEVSDGRLTIDSGAAANLATRIDYVQIVGIPSGPNGVPDTPTITEPIVSGPLVDPTAFFVSASDFSDPDGNLHKSSDWEVWTVGPNAEPVWQSLGLEGAGRLHAQLSDGIFINSRAGQISLAQNTDYELHVRFRDDVGSVSSYATQLFHTGTDTDVYALRLQDIESSPAPTWTDIFATPIELPDGNTILSPSDPIIAIDLDGGSSSPGNETVVNAIDGTVGKKYLNFGEVNSGFIVTPSNGSSIVTGFQISTANDAVERDPSAWELYGTDDTIVSADHSTGTAENWTLIASGSVSLPSGRNTLGPQVNFANTTEYESYRMVFTQVKNAAAANSMQIGEIEFFGQIGGPEFVPPKLLVEDGATADELLSIEGGAQMATSSNIVTDAPALDYFANTRLVIESSSANLVLNQSTLAFRDSQGVDQEVYLPAVDLAAGERLDLWVSTDGSTYFGNAAQTAPDFSSIARTAPIPGVPYEATQPGYVIDLVGTDYRLPVNIAFVPDPGPNPTDPLYYVTELYGSIQVVTRDGTKHEFATSLLDYNPDGPISGSGEQGLTGIAVRRDPNDPDVYELYVGMLWDNGSPPPDGTHHYPKVERITSAPGGLTMATREVLLNMQPLVQGQSHQISNISFGPDGMLYVHNGDGFSPEHVAEAQDLNSFYGKILRMNLDGTAAADNPFYNANDGITARDYVYGYGLRNPFGGAWRASDGMHYMVENGPSVDRFSQLVEGRNYLYDGSNASMSNFAIYNWSPASAPINIAFVQPETFNGSQFPASKQDHAFVSQSGITYATGVIPPGKRVTEFVLDENGDLVNGPTDLLQYTGTGKSTVAALAAGPDGLYFSELYEETGANGPTAVGARLYRIRYVNPIKGDYDIDGDVDDDDAAVWRSTFGSNLLLAADGNGNGVVDAADYVVWRKAKAEAELAAAAVVTAAPTQLSPSVTPVAGAAVVDSEPIGEAVGSTQDDAPSPVSPRIVDVALADRDFRPQTRIASRLNHRTAVAAHVDDASLLLAISAKYDAADRSSGNRVAGTTADSSSDGRQLEFDDLFAELRLDLLHW